MMREESRETVRDTIDAVLTTPFSNAARNATLTIVIFKLLVVPYAYLASLCVIVFTFFPLTYPWAMVTPWVLGKLLVGAVWRSMLLLVLAIVALSGTSDSAQRLYARTHIGEYVIGFSLVLGVYMFGLQGVLFGPMLVCGAKLFYDFAGDVIHQAEGLNTPPPGAAGQTPGAPEPPTEERAAAGIQRQISEWASGGNELLRTMRRLSFFSPDASEPVGRGVPRATAPAAAAAPWPAHAVVTVAVASHPAGRSVRVPLPLHSPWPASLEVAQARLAAAGLMPAGCVVARLFAEGGEIVSDAHDVRPSERLVADTAVAEAGAADTDAEAAVRTRMGHAGGAYGEGERAAGRQRKGGSDQPAGRSAERSPGSVDLLLRPNAACESDEASARRRWRAGTEEPPLLTPPGAMLPTIASSGDPPAPAGSRSVGSERTRAPRLVSLVSLGACAAELLAEEDSAPSTPSPGPASSGWYT